MPFTGKATFNAGADLPELAEDVSDIIGIISPWETPLLDHLGDAPRAAQSTIHEWIEDDLLPNFDTVNQTTFTPNAQDATSITVANGSRFRVGDQVRPGNAREVLLVTAVAGNVLTVTRRYGNSPASNLANGLRLTILGNAALEGDDKPDPRFTNRSRKRNYTQIFTAGVEVSGSMLATRAYGVADELDYQKQMRLRELLRDMENCVINGVAPTANQQGSATVRRTMNGILPSLVTNNFTPGSGGIPAGGGAGTDLNEAVLNAALRIIWDNSAAKVDTIVVGGAMKRRINAFLTGFRQATPSSTVYRDLVSLYESDFGACRVVLSRWVPGDTVLLIDSTRIDVMPLAGRSFQYKPMAATGDRDGGVVIGEYTLEVRNESAHGVIRGLT
jgi:hypothetical protein